MIKTLDTFLEITEHNKWIKYMYIDTGKYLAAINYIIEHKPKFIVEYGGGQSTFMITKLLNYLDYGGKIVGYESDEYWYNFHVERGWNKHNNIKLVDITQTREDGTYGVRYVHPIEDIEGVDFVILDGPELKKFKNNEDPHLFGFTKSDATTTFNLKDIVNHLGKQIPYFIDGRQGTLKYYQEILEYGKINLHVKDIQNED